MTQRITYVITYVMYKTISISNDTYQHLNTIASRLNKPKARVVDELVKGYFISKENSESKDLKQFNAFVEQLTKRIKLPSGTKVKTDDMDKDFAALKNADF